MPTRAMIFVKHKISNIYDKRRTYTSKYIYHVCDKSLLRTDSLSQVRFELLALKRDSLTCAFEEDAQKGRAKKYCSLNIGEMFYMACGETEVTPPPPP